MPSLRLKISYNKNEGLLISPSELMEQYLFGIFTCSTDGRKLPQKAIKNQIQVAQKQVENLFSIKLNKQVIRENRDFTREEFNAWGFVRATYPISFIGSLKGYINEVCQIIYPREWLSLKKTSAVATFRNLYLIPNSGGANKGAIMTQNSVVYNGITPHLNFWGMKFLPNYWRLKYITGWDADEIPDDLVNMISQYAAIQVLAIIGSYLYGVAFSSISISLDGVSQNTPLTRGGKYGMFTDRIQLYMDQINQNIETMKYIYHGITFFVV